MAVDELVSNGVPSWMQFQNNVAHLFRIAGYEVVPDILLVFKKVDLLVSERRLGKIHRVAVECKYWNETHTQQDLTKIYTNYFPLIPGSIDEILIVTRLGATESASAMVATSPHLRHLSFAELQASIMDFGAYLNRQISQYSEDGFPHFCLEHFDHVVEKFIDPILVPLRPRACSSR